MPFKLSKTEEADRTKLCQRLTEAREKLDSALEAFNTKLQELSEPLVDSIASYNEILEESRGFVQDIVSQAEEEIGDKSEKWQEGDKGSAAIGWKEAWEEAVNGLTDVELEIPGALELDVESHAEMIEELSDSAE